ncbi:hypothetical protein, partial [Campylobacter fetus]|uniref:hypothetical protein n=1 Tax=Campylobacter fetus TaxID=196 RepID=UPI0037447D89
MTPFEDILQQINTRRDELFVRADEFVFNDYGAGARDENRSPEIMDIGVKCKKTLKDFAYIGVKNDNAKLLFVIIKNL